MRVSDYVCHTRLSHPTSGLAALIKTQASAQPAARCTLSAGPAVPCPRVRPHCPLLSSSAEVYKTIPRSRDRYITDKFSWEEEVQSEAPTLVYRQVCNDAAGCRGYTKIPKDPEHLYDILMTDNIPSYAGKLTTEKRLSCGPRACGFYIAPSARHCFKYPDDVVYLNNLVQHSVLLGYQPETTEIDKWGNFWRSYSHRKDRVDSFTYATKIASGSRDQKMHGSHYCRRIV
ncbi:hypothetical protein GQ600_12083 [Phytophthora cactorum]|nr:hypothetical protein GQ600_12083 [Phytophthora cactorum]